MIVGYAIALVMNGAFAPEATSRLVQDGPPYAPVTRFQARHIESLLQGQYNFPGSLIGTIKLKRGFKTGSGWGDFGKPRFYTKNVVEGVVAPSSLWFGASGWFERPQPWSTPANDSTEVPYWFFTGQSSVAMLATLKGIRDDKVEYTSGIFRMLPDPEAGEVSVGGDDRPPGQVPITEWPMFFVNIAPKRSAAVEGQFKLSGAYNGNYRINADTVRFIVNEKGSHDPTDSAWQLWPKKLVHIYPVNAGDEYVRFKLTDGDVSTPKSGTLAIVLWGEKAYLGEQWNEASFTITPFGSG